LKAITIMQPWAQLVALRAKRYETRSWKTNYRGPLAIHSSLEFPQSARRLCRCEPFATALLGNEDLPLGCVIATCNLAAVIPTSPDPESLFGESQDFPSSELAFGDFTAGRFAWHLTNVRMFENPIPTRGARSLWDWNEEELGLLIDHQTSIMKKQPSNKQQFRQGDILIERVPSLQTTTPREREKGRVILAHGEVTGHAHEIEKPKLASLHDVSEAMRLLGDLGDAGTMTQSGLIVSKDTAVIHQEHATIPLEAGEYIVRRQREYSPEAIRNVAD
jgi:hypothetical protein